MDEIVYEMQQEDADEVEPITMMYHYFRKWFEQQAHRLKNRKSKPNPNFLD